MNGYSMLEIFISGLIFLPIQVVIFIVYVKFVRQLLFSERIEYKMRGFEQINEKQLNADFGNYDLPVLCFKEPRRGTKLSAGYDIFAPYSFTLAPGEDIKIPTGFKAYMQPGEVLVVVPRSGLGFKYYTRMANTLGIIDADYYSNEDNDGHIWVKMRNEGDKQLVVNRGEAFCQAIFMPFLLVDGDGFNSGMDRTGGFGSTSV